MPIKTERNRPGRRVQQPGEAVDDGPLHSGADPAAADEAVQRDATYREAQAQRDGAVGRRLGRRASSGPRLARTGAVDEGEAGGQRRREGADTPRALREEPVGPQGGHKRRPPAPLKDAPHHRKIR